MTEIDLNNFDISKVTSLWCMFRRCTSLTSINISKWDTSKIQQMNGLFSDCTSLTSINLSNFYTPAGIKMDYMFNGTIKLEYINIQNFDASTYQEYNNFFDNIPENVVVCIKNEIKNDKLLNQLKSKKCFNIDCSDDWRLNQKKLIIGTDKCIESCSNDNQNMIEYKGKCYNNCLINDDNKYLNICACKLEQCLLCQNEAATRKGLCTKCNYDYYPKENDSYNIGEYIKCYKKIEGYYIDKNESIFKKCYETCETCIIKGDNIIHNCLTCKSNYKYKTIINNNLNCYNNCSFYYYINDNSSFCTNNYSCPDEFNKLIEDKIQCVNNCSNDNKYKYEFRKKCYEICPEGSIIQDNDTINNIFTCKAICPEDKPYEIISSQECVKKCSIKDISNNLCIYNYISIETEEIKYNETEKEKVEKEIKAQDNMLKNLEEDFTSEEYDTTNLESGHDEVIKNKQTTITFTTTENQKNNTNSDDNVTLINLCDCETLLRKEYKISDNELLYFY